MCSTYCISLLSLNGIVLLSLFIFDLVKQYEGKAWNVRDSSGEECLLYKRSGATQRQSARSGVVVGRRILH